MEFIYQDSDELGVIAGKFLLPVGIRLRFVYDEQDVRNEHSHALTSINGFALFTAETAGLRKDEYFTMLRKMSVFMMLTIWAMSSLEQQIRLQRTGTLGT